MNQGGSTDTIPRLIRRNSQQWGGRTAMSMKNLGIWQRYSWKTYFENVKYFSLGLMSMGLQPRDVVAIIGDNEPEWFWGQFATQAAGGIPTGIFVDSVPAEVLYIADHARAKFAIVNDQEQADKFLEIKQNLSLLKKIIYWDPKGLKNYDDPLLISFKDVVKLGREYEESHPGLFEQRLEAGRADDTAFIYYTSGTTGQQKGALLKHGALISTARSFISRYIMENGRIVLDGTAEFLKNNEDVKEFYIGLSAVGAKKSYRAMKHYKRRKRWL